MVMAISLGSANERESQMSVQTEGPVLRWQTLNTIREEDGILISKYLTERAKVPGGWLVISQFQIGSAHGLVFLPDPNHLWDGGSLP
jgi:hypothetical protein